MKLAILLAVASGATWAIGMTVAKPALRHIDILSYMLGRWLLVVPLALLYASLTGSLAFPGTFAVGMAALAGVLDSAVGGFFYMLAMERTPAYQTTTLASTAPVWGVSTAILILAEPARWEVFAAAALAVAGAYFLLGRRLRIRRHALGTAFGLLTGFLWGFSETIPAKLALRAGLSPSSLLVVFGCTGMLAIAAMLPVLRSRFPRRIDRSGIRLTALSGIGGAFLGWLFWLSALEIAPASVISPVRGSTLVFAFLYSMFFLRERPNRTALFGVALVLGGVLLVSTAK